MVFKENISHQLDVISGVKAHSIVFKGNQPTEPYAFFLAYQSSDGNVLDPEIYPRASIYLKINLYKILKNVCNVFLQMVIFMYVDFLKNIHKI